MINRCTKPDDPSYQLYGARGIAVCDRWLTFENFRDDMYDSYKQHVEEFGEDDTSMSELMLMVIMNQVIVHGRLERNKIEIKQII